MQEAHLSYQLKSTSLIFPEHQNTSKDQCRCGCRSRNDPYDRTKMIEAKNNNAVTKLVIPVLPPAAIPALDSTTVVTVEVPTIAPAAVEIASDINASFIWMISPSLSIMPDFFCRTHQRSDGVKHVDQ